MNLVDRGSALLEEHIGALQDAVAKMPARRPFHTDAWVVLPEHLHSVWTLPEADAYYSAPWQAIKTEFSKQIPLGEYRSLSRETKGERGVWQRRFWEHTIRNGRDYAIHVDYVHFNPVRHKLVNSVAARQYSSFQRAVARGVYPADWGGGGGAVDDAGDGFGER